MGSDPSLQSRFSRERTMLSRFEGPTSEPSCSGTALVVYLSGDAVRHLDWTIETSTQLIRRQYYFDSTSPRLVVETIHATLDAEAERLAAPRLLSSERYPLDAPQPTAHQRELLDHAKFLMDDFKKHRKEFTRANTPPPANKSPQSDCPEPAGLVSMEHLTPTPAKR